jgi:hypothetical protein
MRRCNTLQLLVQKEMEGEFAKKRKVVETVDVGAQMAKKKK